MFRVIERLLRLTKLWIVCRTHSSPGSRAGSGVSILRTSAPMSASIIAGSSAGATRASSRILIPSSTPMCGSSEKALVEICLEAGGQRADVWDVLEVRQLLGHALGLVGREHGARAREELLAKRRVRQRRVGVAPRAARLG